MSPYAENPNYVNLLSNVYQDRIKPIIETENMLVPKKKPLFNKWITYNKKGEPYRLPIHRQQQGI